MLKFEGIAAVGDRIRAYDFHQRTDCYVEGVVKSIHDKQGFLAYEIVVEVDYWRGYFYPTNDLGRPIGRLGMTVFVPMEVAFMEWDGRIETLSHKGQ